MHEDYLKAIRQFCDYRERTHNEVRYKLVEIGARGEELESLIAKMVEEGLLNETRYAQSYVRGKFNYNHWGIQKIKQNLVQKGISNYNINLALKEIDELAYNTKIFHLLEQKMFVLKSGKNDFAKGQKVIKYLMQKGFEYNHVISALEQWRATSK